jgi:hypothetical protein
MSRSSSSGRRDHDGPTRQACPGGGRGVKAVPNAGRAADCLQPTPCSGFRQQLTPSVRLLQSYRGGRLCKPEDAQRWSKRTRETY